MVRESPPANCMRGRVRVRVRRQSPQNPTGRRVPNTSPSMTDSTVSLQVLYSRALQAASKASQLPTIDDATQVRQLLTG